MVDVRFERRCAIATEPRIPDQIQPGGEHFLSESAALQARSASELDDLYVIPRAQPGDEAADVARNSALRLAEVRRI